MKRIRVPFSLILRYIAVSLLLAALILAYFEYLEFIKQPLTYPPGSTIAGVSVANLDHRQAADKLRLIYGMPVELIYHGSVIHIHPEEVGFKLDVDLMIATANQQTSRVPHLPGYWDFLWNRQVTVRPPADVPLFASIDEEKLEDYLINKVATRYDYPPTQARPVPGTTLFLPGQPGVKLDSDSALPKIVQAFYSPYNRSVEITHQVVPPLPATASDLNIVLHQLIITSGFEGLVELYLQDLQSNQKIHFAVLKGQDIVPDIAFTAASTMKIPIAISVLRRSAEPTPSEILDLLSGMLIFSQNPPSDSLMQKLDPNLGPLIVSDDLQEMGLQNTFIAGYFYLGAPLLRKYQTPANTRSDINLHPDVYNQTTPAEIGLLLEGLYQCAERGSGLIIEKFQGQVSSTECTTILSFLQKNKTGLLLEAGLPEGTQIAHKHGWIEEADGLLHTMSDVGIVYTPGGNYVLAIYVYHPDQLIFYQANWLVARLSQAIYNYFNVYTNMSGLVPAYIPAQP